MIKSVNRIVNTIVFFLMCYNNLFSQWITQNPPSQYRFWSIDFPSANVGYIGGLEGTYKSIDGGNTWSKLQYLSPKYSQADSIYLEGINEQFVHFISDSIGVIAGWSIYDNSEIIIRTTDGGATWKTKQKGAFETGFKSIFFTNDSIGYVAGLKGRILKTTNAGDTWTPLTTGTSNDLYGIHFTDSNNGYAVGDYVVLKTVNGGNSWSKVSTSIYGLSVCFINPSTGYVGTTGSIFKTTDGGSTWNNTYFGQYQYVNKILFTNDSTGYLVTGLFDNGKVYKTNSYGNYWEPMPSANDKSILLDVFFKSELEGFVVGDTGTIKHTLNAGGNTKPVSKFQLNSNTYCQFDTALLLNKSNPKYTFTWMMDDSIVSNSYHPKLTLNKIGLRKIKLISNNGYYKDTLGSEVKVGEKITITPFVSKIENDSLCDFGSAVLKILNTDKSATYTIKNKTRTILNNVKGNDSTLECNTGRLNAYPDSYANGMPDIYDGNKAIYIYTIEATKTTDCNTMTVAIKDTITVFKDPDDLENNDSIALTYINKSYCHRDSAEIILKNTLKGWKYQLAESGRNIGQYIMSEGGDIKFYGDSLYKYSNTAAYDQYGQLYKTKDKEYFINAINPAGCLSVLTKKTWIGNGKVRLTFSVNDFKPNFDLKSWGVYPGDTLRFKTTIPTDISSYNWYLTDASITKSIDSLPNNVTYLNPGDYPIKLVAKSRSANCIDSIEKIVNVFNPLPSNISGTYCLKSAVIDSSNKETLLAQHVDRFGNIYLTGYITNYPDYYEKYDFFIKKLDKQGKLLWSKTCDKDTRPIVFAKALVSDSLGNIYVGGSYNSGRNFSIDGKLIHKAWSSGFSNRASSTSAFLLKLNSSGKLLWVIIDTLQKSNSTHGSGISDILIDGIQNLHIAVSGYSTLKMPDGKLESIGWGVFKIDTHGRFINNITINNNGAYNQFIGGATTCPFESSSFPNSGNFFSEYPKIKMASDGRIVVVFNYIENGGPPDLYNRFGINNTKMNLDYSSNCLVIAVYDTTLNWVKAFIPIQAPHLGIPHIDIDKNDNVYLGSLWTTNAADKNHFVYENNIIVQAHGAYLAKFDLNGNTLWLNNIENNLNRLYSSTFLDGVVVNSRNNPVILTAMKDVHEGIVFYSQSIDPIGVKNDSSNIVFLNEYNQNGNLLSVDTYKSKVKNFSRHSIWRDELDNFGVLTRNSCGDVYYVNSFYDITIDSTSFSNKYCQLVFSKFATDYACEKHNCIPVTKPSIFVLDYKELCDGETAELQWDAFYVNKVNIILSTNADKNIDTLVANYDASASCLEKVISGKAGWSKIVIQDITDNKVADTIVFMMLPKPIVYTSNDSTICLEKGKTFTLQASGNGNNYIWQPGNITGEKIVIYPKDTTNTKYSVTVTDLNGCINSDTVNVAVKYSPTLVVSKDTVVCDESNQAVILKANSKGSGNVFLWEPGGITDSILNVLPKKSATLTYTVSVTNKFNCQSLDSVKVTSDKKPVISVSNDTAICDNAPITLTASANGSGNIYLWQPGNLSGSRINLTPPKSTVTNYTVSVNSKYGCKNSDVVKVTSQKMPMNSILNLSRDNSIVLYPSLISPELSYQWNYNYEIIPGATSDSLITNKPGYYSLTTTDKQTGCLHTTPDKSVLLADILINEITNNNKIIFSYDDNFVSINLLGDKPEHFDDLSFSDMNGKVVYSEKDIVLYQGVKKQIAVDLFSSGIYMLILKSNEQMIGSKVTLIR